VVFLFGGDELVGFEGGDDGDKVFAADVVVGCGEFRVHLESASGSDDRYGQRQWQV
jgi:hypothetical protein